ncbi:MAG: Rieske (2Fe-2S) protein [Gammaproteobacteria bacterium]
MTRHRLAALDDLWIDELTACRAGARNLVVVRTADAVYAYEDRCAHLGVPLSRGRLAGNVLVCSAHHWRYDVCSGRGINPASARLAPVRVEIDGGQLYAIFEREEQNDG